MKKVFTKEEFIQRARLIEKVLFQTFGFEENNLPIEFNKTASEYGCFYYRNGKADKITYCSAYLDGIYELDDIDDTIAHELIHQLIFEHVDKKETHGRIFRKYYKEFTGREYDKSNKSQEIPVEMLKKSYKHVFKCDGCGKVVTRTRASRFTKNYKFYTCGNCGDTFTKC